MDEKVDGLCVPPTRLDEEVDVVDVSPTRLVEDVTKFALSAAESFDMNEVELAG